MSLKTKMFNGMVWSAVDRIAMQFARFILGLVLARLLTPKEYGTVGLILVFVAMSRVFIDSGFSNALIQKKDRNQYDISTAFVFNIIISLICYLVLFILAPYVADFYNIPLLTLLLRVISLSLIINALYIIPSTLFTIDLDFKSLAKINFTATMLSGIIAIIMAYYEYGVWALVWQTILRSVINLILMWSKTKWKISFVFNYDSFKKLFSYGSNLLVSALLGRFVSDFSSLMIGKMNSAKDLGLYSRGIQFTDFFSSTIEAIINKVLLPSLSSLQDEVEILRIKFKKIFSLTALICCPIFFGLFILSEPLIKVLLTDKWIEAVPIMQIFCFSRLLSIFCSTNINILYIIGRTDLILKQQYWAIATRIILVGTALKFGIFYIAIAELIATSIHLYINSFYPGKLIHYKFKAQLSDIMIYVFYAAVMLITMYISMYPFTNSLYRLIIGCSIGSISYFLLIYYFKKTDIDFVRDLIKGMRNK